jgi:hypothetical protein
MKLNSNNLTIGFYPDRANGTCVDGAGIPAGAIGLKTPSYNFNEVCFNLDELFSQNNDSGWARPSTQYQLQPFQWGIKYTLINRLSFNVDTSYTGVFIESTNTTQQSGPVGAEAGKNSARRVQVFEQRNCADIGTQWETTCQTRKGGQCHRANSTFKSFRIGRAYPLITVEGQCKNFQLFAVPNAASIGASLSWAVAGLAVVAAVWGGF